MCISLLFLLAPSLLKAEVCHDLLRPFLLPPPKERLITTPIGDQIDLTRYGLSNTIYHRERFDRLSRLCLSPNNNGFKQLANYKMNGINLKMSYAATVVGYTNNNKNQNKDLEWFGRLGLGLTVRASYGTLFSKILKGNESRFSYILKDYFLTRLVTVGYIGSAMILFTNNKAEKIKLEELKKSPTFNSDLEKLQNYANDETLLKRFKKETMAFLSQLKIIDTGLGIHEGVDFNHLTQEDLSDPDIQKVVLAALIAEEYEKQQGSLALTGSKMQDFYLYDSLYSLTKIPKDIFVDKTVNKIVCLNTYNSHRGMTQAVGISALNQILFADYYGLTYRVLKKGLIDQ